MDDDVDTGSKFGREADRKMPVEQGGSTVSRDVMGIFPKEASAARLISAPMLEQIGEFQRQRR